MFIGIDFVEVERVRKLIEYKRYISEVFTKKEINLINKRYGIRKLAGVFAVKEATVKAFGTGFENGNGILLKDLEIIFTNDKKPVLKLYNSAKIKAQELGIKDLNISLTYTKRHALAVVIFS